jgi:hypothetical protein
MRARLQAMVALGVLIATSACGDHELALPCGDDIDVREPWLLAIDEDDGTTDALFQISVEPGYEGTVTVLCDDLELPAGFPDDTNFTTLAYHGGTLYASAMRETWGDTLVRIDPCACTVSEVGSYGFDYVSGITSAGDERMFGIAADVDAMIEIDPQTGVGELGSALDEDWGSHGLSWSAPEDDLLYAINAETDRLYRFRASDGSPIDALALSEDFSAVGVEYHPGRDELFACGVRDRGTALFVVDLDSGLVRLVAEDVFTATCDNLAAPSGPIHCAH